MKAKNKTTNYPSRNIKTETYLEGETSVSKLYYDAKDAYVKELTKEKDGIKEIKHFNVNGVLSKIENFVNGKREGVETRYLVSKAPKTVKSTKTYVDGKLHGESITYDENSLIIKKEIFEFGKKVVK